MAVPDPIPAAPGRTRFVTVSLARETGVLLALSLLFPYMVHVIPVPQDAQLGSRLLPMFYAPLLALLLGRSGSAWIIAVLAPWLNWAVTSHPSPRGAIAMEAELVVFVIVLERLLAARGPRWYLSVPAYAFGMAAAALLALFFPSLIGGRPALDWMVSAVVTGLPGVAVFVLITLLVPRLYPPGGGNRSAAA